MSSEEEETETVTPPRPEGWEPAVRPPSEGETMRGLESEEEEEGEGEGQGQEGEPSTEEGSSGSGEAEEESPGAGEPPS
jgi:hypothetical protein